MSDTKTALTASLVAVISHYCMTYISSGDRHLDNQLNTLITMSLSILMGFMFVIPRYFKSFQSRIRYMRANNPNYLIDGEISIDHTEFDKMKVCFDIENWTGIHVLTLFLNEKPYVYVQSTRPTTRTFYRDGQYGSKIETVVQDLKASNKRRLNLGDENHMGCVALAADAPCKIYRYDVNEYVYMRKKKDQQFIQIRCKNEQAMNKFMDEYIHYLEECMKRWRLGSNVTISGQKIYHPFHVPQANGNSATGHRIIDTVGAVSEKKCFDNLFFQEKDRLLRMLDKFNSGKMYPPTTSMENKLGILLYGPPGTGKTGTISAIANYLKRDIVMIDLTVIKSREQLDNLLMKNNFEYAKHIFVLEEIDIVLDVIKSRKKEIDIMSETCSDTDSEKTQLAEKANSSTTQTTTPAVQQEHPLDLAYLLQLFDGVDSNKDRLIIMTTNYPDEIDEALLRPGRIDLKLKLGNCNRQMVRDLVSRYFELEETGISLDEVGHITEDLYTPTQVINRCIQLDSWRDVIASL